MSDLKTWLHQIRNKNTGQYYHVVDGAVQTSVSEMSVTFGPDGWQEISLGWERDMQKLGITRNFSVPLSFVRDGAAILRHLFYEQNIENEVELIIKRHKLEYTGATYQHTYTVFYTGVLDITSIKDDGIKVSVSVSEGGINKAVKANTSTPYELDMSTDFINVLMDGLLIEYSAEMMAFADSYIANQTTGSRQYFMNYANISSEQNRLYLALFDIFKTSNNSINYATNSNYFLHATGPVTFDFTFRLNGTHSKDNTTIGTSILNIWLKKQDGSTVATLYSNTLIGTTHTTAVNVNTTIPITLTTDDKLFLVMQITVSAVALLSAALTIDDSTTRISYSAEAIGTIVKAKLPSQVFKELTEHITGNENDCDTSFVEANDNFALTTGDALRNISGAKMKTSLDNFIQFQKVVNAAGFGIESGVLTIQPYEHFFSTADPIQLNRIKNITSSYANDLLFNTVRIGYNEMSVENINGKYEFNNTHVYGTPVKSINKELSLVCPYYAQPYVIEFTRINFEGKNTTDTDSDNDIFILNVDLENPIVIDGVTVYPLKRKTYTAAAGIPDIDSMFNIEGLTPKHLLKKHMKWINSVLYRFDGQFLTFLTTEQGASLEINDGGIIIAQDADEVIGTDRLFLPYYIDIDTDGAVTDLVEELDTQPNASFVFGAGCEAFLIKAGLQPDTKQEQAYKLLAAPSLDISNLHTDGYE